MQCATQAQFLSLSCNLYLLQPASETSRLQDFPRPLWLKLNNPEPKCHFTPPLGPHRVNYFAQGHKGGDHGGDGRNLCPHLLVRFFRHWYEALAPHLFTSATAVHFLYILYIYGNVITSCCQQWVTTCQENARPGGDGYTYSIWHFTRLQPLLTSWWVPENVWKKFNGTLKENNVMKLRSKDR